MADFVTELRSRRVLPAVGVYVASCWVLIEILDRLVERYLLSPYLTDIIFLGLYSLIPTVTLVAWTHGKPGKDKATRVEKVGVPINLIATLGLLLTVFGDKDLNQAATAVTVSNELGQQETHYIPSESFRRRMAVFFFDNDTGDHSQDWLKYAVTELLVQDLQQDPFVLASSPYQNFGNGYYARMRQAGFLDATGIPTSLKREIADDANRQYFVEGSFNIENGQYLVNSRILETRTLKEVANISLQGWDLYETIDRMSREIRDELEVPRGSGRIAADLPLSETYGESEDALMNYIGGLNQRLFHNDFAASNVLFEAALESDPNFVLGHFMKAVNLIESGDWPAANEAVQSARKLDYRLPETDRVTLKALNYRITGETDKLMDFLRMQVKLKDDAASHSRLANMLTYTGELEEAKQEFKIALRRDSLNVGVYLALSLLERLTGDIEAAIAYAREYQLERPEEIDAHMQLGDLLRDTGELEQAEKQYEQAQLLDDYPVQPTLRLVIINSRKGDERKARALLEEAERLAQTPSDRASVHQAASFFEARLGRIDAAIRQLYKAQEYMAQTQPPFAVALATYSPIVNLQLSRGNIEGAEAALEKALGLLEPPMDQFLAFSEAMVLVQKGELQQASAALERGVEIIEQLKFEPLKFQISLVQAGIHEARGDYADMSLSLILGIEQVDKSFIAAELYAQYVPRIYAELAHAQVMSEDMQGADVSLTRGFRLDPSEPMLWMAKAKRQNASGSTQLAMASVNYALAIWESSDSGFVGLEKARELVAEINESAP